MKTRQHRAAGMLFLLVTATIGVASHPPAARAANDTRSIIFPVLGKTSYHDDYGDPRSGGRTHEGNDLLGKKMQPLLAAVDGVVTFVAYPEASWGYSLTIEDSDGYRYWYLHVNNDTPGTDDGKGNGIFAYAPDMARRAYVAKGQIIGWMGDSGNAEATSPHLHFEIHTPDGDPVNPYPSLQAATHVTAPARAYPQPGDLLPFGEFKGGASIASGQVDASTAAEELVVGAGPGGGPLIQVLDQAGTSLAHFYAYDQSYRGGVNVAVGDLTGDGIDEIITGRAARRSDPLVRVFASNGTLLSEFQAYDPRALVPVSVAAADMNGDGVDEIITGAGVGGGPDVRVFTLNGQILNQFYAYDRSFRYGIDVTALAATETEPAVIVTALSSGSVPEVRTFTAAGILQSQFMAYETAFRGGVRVAVFDLEGVGRQILTAPGRGGGPHILQFNLAGEITDTLTVYERWWRGGYDLTVADGVVYVSTYGGRRTAIRIAE